MNTAARLDILTAALRALLNALPPEVAADALGALRQQVVDLPPVPADADAARAAELAPLLAALTGRQVGDTQLVPTNQAGLPPHAWGTP